MTKQAYYKHDESRVLAQAARDAFALEYIKHVRTKDPGIGGVKLWHMYRRDLRKPRTTDSSHGLPTYPNLVKDFIPTAPDQLWVSDITYITIWEDAWHYFFCYLSLILDAYTEEIVGWSVGPTLETAYPLKALKMALKRISGKKDIELIHHSDRGCQYASSDYIKLLNDNHIQISMTESGDPKDNAQAERINNTMKNELFKDIRFSRIAEVVAAVAHAVDFYNNERPHMSIDMMTPAEAAFCEGEIKKHWISYRERAIREKQALEIPVVYLCPSFRGLPPASGRQSTPERDKTWKDNQKTAVNLNQ